MLYNKLGIIIFTSLLLIPATSLANAQEYTTNDKQYYNEIIDNKINDNGYLYNNNEPNYIDEDNKQYYYHYYPDKENKKFQELIKGCEECFLQELYYQLSDEQRYFFFDAIKYEFGSLEKLCILIVNGKISEKELKDILRHIGINIQKQEQQQKNGNNIEFSDTFDIEMNMLDICINTYFNGKIVKEPKSGNLDMAVTIPGDVGGNVSILLGNGDGTFGPQTNFPVGSESTYVAVGLFDADYNLDLAVANLMDDDVSILLGNGDGTFGPKTDFPVGDGPSSIAVGLFDADYNFDLAVSNSGVNVDSTLDNGNGTIFDTVSILLGNGDGTFGPKTDFPVGFGPSSVAVGLFDADHNLDLAVANAGNVNTDRTVSILLGNGDGTFGPKTDFLVGPAPASVAVGLFDADYNLDLAVSDPFNNEVSILLGNGDGTFGPRTTFPVGIGPLHVAVGLFDADNNLDLAVANADSNDVSILLGNGDGTFGPKTDFPVGDGQSFIVVGFFNADSNLDLAVANSIDDDVTILLGDGDGTFGQPNSIPLDNVASSIAVGEFNTN
ncbi:MAG: hypothetical protein ACPKQO_11075 [Nitrososphaeraceae archaeon]